MAQEIVDEMALRLPNRFHSSPGSRVALGPELIGRLQLAEIDLQALISRASPTGSAGQREMTGADSIAAMLTHLADTELVYGFRLRAILTGDCPRLSQYDEQAWSARFGDLDPDPQEGYSRWRALRASNVRILESAGPSGWDRAGLHSDRGRITVAGIARSLVIHDRGHLDHLRRTLASGHRSSA